MYDCVMTPRPKKTKTRKAYFLPVFPSDGRLAGERASHAANRSGQSGGENKWVSRSWLEPTLPQRAREGWGNLVRNLDSERMGQPPKGWTARISTPSPRIAAV